AELCIPHSVLSRPAQRPERESAADATCCVHGRHPIDGKPRCTKGLTGTSCAAMYAATSGSLQVAMGLIFTSPRPYPTIGVDARDGASDLRSPLIQACLPRRARSNSATLAAEQ